MLGNRRSPGRKRDEVVSAPLPSLTYKQAKMLKGEIKTLFKKKKSLKYLGSPSTFLFQTKDIFRYLLRVGSKIHVRGCINYRPEES